MTKVHNTKNPNVYDMIYNWKTSNVKDNKFVIKTNSFYSAENDVFHIDTSSFSLNNIVLPKNVQEEIKDVIYEHLNSDYFENMNLLPSNKIILEGEPGCGKTMIAYIISNALKRELKIVNLSKIISSHLGETASNLSSIFEKYSNENHILFIDEFDIIGRLRGDTNTDHNEMKRIVNSLLQLIDYFPTKGILIFATNDIKIIDKALLRRMDRIIHVPLPTKANIKTFIKNKLIEYKQQIGDINYNELVKKYNGESYSNIDRDMKNKIKKYVIETRKKNIKNFKISTEVFL